MKNILLRNLWIALLILGAVVIAKDLSGNSAPFKCPDDYPSFKEEAVELAHFSSNYLTYFPTATIEELLIARRGFLVGYDCKGALQRVIRSEIHEVDKMPM